jgi:hypothetical protein
LAGDEEIMLEKIKTVKKASVIGWINYTVMLRLCIAASLILVVLTGYTATGLAAGATTTVRVARYAEDGKQVLAEEMRDYRWLEENLPVCGDGITHYYHQGPVFEGNVWNPEETVNLKDKGAVCGTDIRELCELVGGMSPGDEVVVCSVDGYHVKFAYTNVYTPLSRQGPIVLCWYKCEDTGDEAAYDYGYPGNDAYSSAIQLVLMSETTNSAGQFVFGNDDMRICLPEDKYQHFYEGLPSTNGLSAKWVSEVRVYAKGAPDRIETDDLNHTGEVGNRAIPWLPFVLGSLGLLLVGWSLYFFTRRKG